MLNAGFQYLEQRDANDKITKGGVVGKNSPFATSDNSGIYDIIAEDLRWLKENVDDVKDLSELEAIKQSVTDMYNEMKNDSSFGEATAKAQAEEAKKQAQAALESATNAKTYRDDVVTKSTEANDTLAEIKEYIDKAEKLVDSNKALEQSFSDYATVASNKANEASTSATNAKTSETNAATSATNAENSAVNAKLSENAAKDYASKAKISESNAKTSEVNAAASAANAKTSETNASASKSNAATSESNAKSYMDTTKGYADKAQEALAGAQAIQSVVDTAKANAEKCLADVEAVKESLAKMITYQGSVDNYSDLPTSPQVGYSYNVKNADKEHGVNAGDNLVWNGEDWDNFGSFVDMSLFAELGKDANFNTVKATTFTGGLKGNADTATNADKLDMFHENSFLRCRGRAKADGEDTLWGQIGIKEYDKKRPEGVSGTYNYGAVVSLPSYSMRLDVWYNHRSSTNGDGLWYRTGYSADKQSWASLLDSVNYANYAPTRAEFNTVSEQAQTQADWNSTNSSSVDFIKNIPESIKSINNSTYFRVKRLYKTDNHGWPTYRIVEELTNYHPTNGPTDWETYGFSAIELCDIRRGTGSRLEPAFMYASLGYEYDKLQSTSGEDFPVVLHNTESDKYYLAIRTNGSYKNVTLMGTFVHPDTELGEEVLAQDANGTPPSGWELTYKPKDMISMDSLRVGRANDALKLTTARAITLTGDVTGSATFDGSSDVSINATRPYVVGEARRYDVDLSKLDSTKFYPIVFEPNSFILRCEIHSPSLTISKPYNQNVISFRLLSNGWQDTPYSFSIDEYKVRDQNEIAIGCIGRGKQGGYDCVWVRGGLDYFMLSNRKPILHTEDVTFGGNGLETYTVGTNYYGGTGNKNVDIIFTPQETIKEGSWHDGTAYGLFEKATKDADGNVIADTYAKKTGTGASGTWDISITGNAATATKATTALNIPTSDVGGNIWIS